MPSDVIIPIVDLLENVIDSFGQRDPIILRIGVANLHCTDMVLNVRHRTPVIFPNALDGQDVNF